jgi:hypothetical protein
VFWKRLLAELYKLLHQPYPQPPRRSSFYPPSPLPALAATPGGQVRLDRRNRELPNDPTRGTNNRRRFIVLHRKM